MRTRECVFEASAVGAIYKLHGGNENASCVSPASAIGTICKLPGGNGLMRFRRLPLGRFAVGNCIRAEIKAYKWQVIVEFAI